MGASELSSALWVSRTSMERLLYKMETLLLMVSSGRTEWLQHASTEIEEATQILGSAQLHTEVMIAEVAANWGLPTPTTLTQLVEKGTHPVWGQLLEAHLEHVRELEMRIKAASTAAQQYTTQGLISAQEAMAAAGFHPDSLEEATEARILDKAL